MNKRQRKKLERQGGPMHFKVDGHRYMSLAHPRMRALMNQLWTGFKRHTNFGFPCQGKGCSYCAQEFKAEQERRRALLEAV